MSIFTLKTPNFRLLMQLVLTFDYCVWVTWTSWKKSCLCLNYIGYIVNVIGLKNSSQHFSLLFYDEHIQSTLIDLSSFIYIPICRLCHLFLFFERQTKSNIYSKTKPIQRHNQASLASCYTQPNTNIHQYNKRSRQSNPPTKSKTRPTQPIFNPKETKSFVSFTTLPTFTVEPI